MVTQGIFPVTFVPKYLSGCVSHCYIVAGNHGICVHGFIPQAVEVRMFHIVACKVHATFSQEQILILVGLSRQTRKVI